MNRPWISSCLFALTSACASLAPAAEPCDVVIMAGQSNMIGNFGEPELLFMGTDYALPQPDVFEDYRIDGVERATGWGALQPHPEVPNSSYGCELTFGRSLADDPALPQLAILKVAVGGTNLAERWNPNNQNDLYDAMLLFVDQSLAELELLGYEPRVTAFAWWQGDGDLWVPEWVAAYQTNLTNLVAAVRSDLGSPETHALIVQTPINHGKPADLVAQMRQAKADFVAADPHASLINTDDLSFYDSNIHVDGTGRLTVGLRLADAYLNDSVFASPCPADLDADGTLSLDDIDAFILAFQALAPHADFNDDGKLSLDDVAAFTAAYLAGCP